MLSLPLLRNFWLQFCFLFRKLEVAQSGSSSGASGNYRYLYASGGAESGLMLTGSVLGQPVVRSLPRYRDRGVVLILELTSLGAELISHDATLRHTQTTTTTTYTTNNNTFKTKPQQQHLTTTQPNHTTTQRTVSDLIVEYFGRLISDSQAGEWRIGERLTLFPATSVIFSLKCGRISDFAVLQQPVHHAKFSFKCGRYL